MRNDGAKGLLAMKEAGAATVAQDEAMPRGLQHAKGSNRLRSC
jgi:chemotaxis response regulator CheB